MQYIDVIGGCEISDSLIIVEKKDYTDHYGMTQGTHYSVYNNHALVFSGYITNDICTTLYKYEPGQWEKEIIEYLNHIIDEKNEENEKQLRLVK